MEQSSLGLSVMDAARGGAGLLTCHLFFTAVSMLENLISVICHRCISAKLGWGFSTHRTQPKLTQTGGFHSNGGSRV